MKIAELVNLIHNEQQAFVHATYLSKDFLQEKCKEIQKKCNEIYKKNLSPSIHPLNNQLIEEIAEEIASEVSAQACDDLVKKINGLFIDENERQATVKKLQMQYLFQFSDKIKDAILKKYSSSSF